MRSTFQTNIIKVDFKKIREHAKANRWTGHAIAKTTNVTAGTVYAVLRGKSEPAATTLKAICDTIGLPIEDAFTQPKRKAA